MCWGVSVSCVWGGGYGGAYRANSAALEVLGSMDIGFLVVERGRGARRRGSLVVGVASVLYLCFRAVDVEVKSTGAFLVKHLVPQERTVLMGVILASGFVVPIWAAGSQKRKDRILKDDQITQNRRLTTRLPVRTKEEGGIADIWVGSLVLFTPYTEISHRWDLSGP